MPPASGSTNYLFVIASIFFTAVFWGSYGPLLQLGHHGMSGGGRLRPFICVGIAYLIVAIVGPLVLMFVFGNDIKDGFLAGWTAKGIFWSLTGGAAGALGAFGIILALSYGGKPTYVMPLVFGCAPVVSTALSLTINRQWGEINSFFGAGLILVAAGAVTVLITAPGAPKGTHPPKGHEVSKPHKAESEEPAVEPAAASKSDEPAVDAPHENS